MGSGQPDESAKLVFLRGTPIRVRIFPPKFGSVAKRLRHQTVNLAIYVIFEGSSPSTSTKCPPVAKPVKAPCSKHGSNFVFESRRADQLFSTMAYMPNNWTPEFTREYMHRLYVEQRASFTQRLGGYCVRCGSQDDLQFDHIDPTKKSFNVGVLFGKKKLPQVYAELDKCQLLCRQCHQAKTAEESSVRMKAENIQRNGPDGFQHGTVYSFMKAKCQCTVCLNFKQKWNERRNSTRRVANGTARGPYKPRVTKPSSCPDGFAWCSTHAKFLPIDEFTKCTKSKNGLDYLCAKCKADEHQRKKLLKSAA